MSNGITEWEAEEIRKETEESNREAAASEMNIVTIYLKGEYARPGPHTGKDWDRGYLANETSTSVTLADNEYGANQRLYMRGDIARIEMTGHW